MPSNSSSPKLSGIILYLIFCMIIFFCKGMCFIVWPLFLQIRNALQSMTVNVSEHAISYAPHYFKKYVKVCLLLMM
jgi:hypothetical protein